MPAAVLQELQTVTIAAGGALVLPHSLNDGAGNAFVPNVIMPDRATELLVTAADAVNVSYSNPGADPLTAIFLVQFDHTIQQATTTAGNPPFQYWYQGGNAAIVPGTIASTCFVYRPGGGGTGPVDYASWATLYADLDAARTAVGGGCWSIKVDDSIVSPATIPAGVYDMSGVVIEAGEGAGASGLTAIDLTDGVVFTSLRRLRGTMLMTAQLPNSSPISDLANGDYFYASDGVFLVRNGGVVPFIDLAGLGGGDIVRFMFSTNVVIGNGVDAVIDQPTAASRAFFLMGPGSSIAADALTGNATAEQNFIMHSNSAVVADQAAGVGVVSMDPFLAERWNIRLVAATVITVAEVGDGLFCDPSTDPAGCSITLPDATVYNSGAGILIKNVSNSINPITITPTGAQTIEGVAAPLVLTTARESVKLIPYNVGAVGAWAVI